MDSSPCKLIFLQVFMDSVLWLSFNGNTDFEQGEVPFKFSEQENARGWRFSGF